MQPRKNWIWCIALVVVVSFAGACGGAAEEPAEEPAPEATEPVVEATPAPAPMPEPEPEPQEPAPPQLEGNILTSGEDFDWISVTDRNSPASYYWTVNVNNDTTQTLDITVKFDFVDENDAVVKSESKTIRLAPAQDRTIREEGEMSYRDALKVIGFVSELNDWKIVGD